MDSEYTTADPTRMSSRHAGGGNDPQRSNGQNTFLTGREILERARESLTEGCEALFRAPHTDDRMKVFGDVLEALLEEVVNAISRFESLAPEGFHDARAQYVVDPPPPTSPVRSDTEPIIEGALNLLRNLRATFSRLAESAPEGRVEEIYRDLTSFVENGERRIARLEQDLREL